MPTSRYELRMSNTMIGHPKLGYITRQPLNVSDDDEFAIDEDLAFERYLKTKGITAHVRGAVAYVVTE